MSHLSLPMLLALAYLLGSIPFGLLLARLFGGADVRRAGSGNIGATNVARVVGPLAGALTLFFDGAKGYAAVRMASLVTQGETKTVILAGLFAVLGHCFSLWLRFRGGKGVATAAGVFLALCPWALAAALVLFVLVVLLSRFVSLGSLAAAASLPLLVYFLWVPRFAPPKIVTIGTLAMAVVVIWQHRGNVKRLARGEEPRFSLRRSKGAE